MSRQRGLAVSDYSRQQIEEYLRIAKVNMARTNYKRYLEYVHQGKWKTARHLEIVCDRLERVITGEIKRLMIFMPPRHGKSMSVTKTFPSYYLGRFPDKRVIEVSYSDDFAQEFGESNRNIISQFGWEIFGIALAPSNNKKASWSLSGHDGGMVSVGINGTITGRGGDLIIIDDPIKNRLEAESETYRKRLMEGYTDAVYTRQQPGAAIILILTRWHEADLAGKLLKPDDGDPEDWHVISLPCIADSPNDLLGREIGEPLWGEFGFGNEWAERTRKTVGAYTWSSLYQQRPSPAGGGIFRREWTNNRFSKIPANATVIQSWDLPFVSNEASAKCAGIVMARAGANVYIMDLVNDKMEFVDTINAIRDMSAKYRNARAKVIEAAANGYATINMLKDQVPGLIPFIPHGSKEERARATTPYFEAGNVFFPEGAPWVSDMVEDLVGFPNREFKDTVDAMSQGFLYFDSLMGQSGALVYPTFANDSERFLVAKEVPQTIARRRSIEGIYIGVTLKPMRTGIAFVAVLLASGFDRAYVIDELRINGMIDGATLREAFWRFYEGIRREYREPSIVVVGDEENGGTGMYAIIKSTLDDKGADASLRSSDDATERDMILLVSQLLEQNRLHFVDDCINIQYAMAEALWDMTKKIDSRVQDGLSDVKLLEALEIVLSRESRYLTREVRE